MEIQGARASDLTRVPVDPIRKDQGPRWGKPVPFHSSDNAGISLFHRNSKTHPNPVGQARITTSSSDTNDARWRQTPGRGNSGGMVERRKSGLLPLHYLRRDLHKCDVTTRRFTRECKLSFAERERVVADSNSMKTKGLMLTCTEPALNHLRRRGSTDHNSQVVESWKTPAEPPDVEFSF